MSERDRERPAGPGSDSSTPEQPTVDQGIFDSLVARVGPAGAQRAIQRRLAERKARNEQESAAEVHSAAEKGISGAGGPLPHLDAIQRSFGKHNVEHVKAHTDGAAAEGAAAMGAEAFAAGDHVAFAGTPSLHTAAHEAAHVVQQRGGVQLKGGVGEAGDSYEQHADAVADQVTRGESAESLLDTMAGGSTAGSHPVQRRVVQMIPDRDLPALKEHWTKWEEELIKAGGVDSSHMRVFSDASRCDTLPEAREYIAQQLGPLLSDLRERQASHRAQMSGGTHAGQSASSSSSSGSMAIASSAARGPMGGADSGGLADLRRSAPRVTVSNHRIGDGVDSGETNQDCVLAAMATARRYNIATLRSSYVDYYHTEMTSTDEAIPRIATLCGFRQLDKGGLLAAARGKGRVFFRAPAMSGGGWHAYCAVGVAGNGNIIAWDPDTAVGRDCKEVPVDLVDDSMIFG